MRGFYIVCFILLALTIIGCGSMTKSIMAKQEWSENYASIDGVEATSPLMIDGSKRTIGETETPSDSEGATQYTEAIIKLPEQKSIRRVVLYTPNIETFVLYALTDDGKIWKPMKEFKNNKEKMIDIRAAAVTDQIKIRVRETSDDQVNPGERNRWRRVRRAKGKINEIEIYGLVQSATEEIVEMAEPGEQPVGAAVFVSPDSVPQETAPVSQAVEPEKVPSNTATTPKAEAIAKTEARTAVKKAPAPKSATAIKKAVAQPDVPPAIVSLKSPDNSYALAVPIPITVDIKIGADDLVTLQDLIKDEMLITKLLVKTAEGAKITCSQPTPKLSAARPYRSSGRPIDVRVAGTLEAESTFTFEIPDLLKGYSITEAGTYTIQFDMILPVYRTFVGRYQTQIDDLQSSIRDINSTPSLSQSDKASVTKDMREEVEQLKKKKEHRYIVVGSRSKSLKLSSNILEIAIQ